MKKIFQSVLILLIACMALTAAADIKSEWIGGEKMLRWYDDSNGQTIRVDGGVYISDDFISTATADITSTTTDLWVFSQVNGATPALDPDFKGRLILYAAAADDDDSDIANILGWTASKWAGMEARVAFYAPSAKIAFNCGFSDAASEAADTIAVERSGTTIDSTASNCALFFSDYDSTTDYISCMGVKANTDTTAYSVGDLASTELNEYHIYRVQLDPDGKAQFFYDGQSVRTIANAVTASTALTPYLAIMNRAARADNPLPSTQLKIDYIKVWQTR